MSQRLSASSLASLLAAGCGPGAAVDDATASSTSDETTSEATAPASTSASTSSETIGDVFCFESIEGNLVVRTPEDVERARRVAAVSGELAVILDGPEGGPVDLSFLGCLESVGRLEIGDSPSLLTTEGLASLREVWSISISNCENMVEIGGFDVLEEIDSLSIGSLRSLESIQLRTTRRIGRREIAACYGSPPRKPPRIRFWSSTGRSTLSRKSMPLSSAETSP